MKSLLIISDVHGYEDRLKRILEIETVDMVVSLGDLEVSKETQDQVNILIHGNAYLDPGEAKHVLDTEAFRIVFTHGHHEHVNRSDHGLYRLLKAHEADLLFHGHTHAARISEVRGGWLINPGAVSHSRSTFPESYGVLDVHENEATLTLKSIIGQPLKTHRFVK